MYSESCQVSKKELFENISYIIDLLQDPEYTPG